MLSNDNVVDVGAQDRVLREVKYNGYWGAQWLCDGSKG